jgi:MFS family permease
VEPLKEERASEVRWSKKSPEEKKLVRKIDLFLMPTIWVLYLLSYMDRTNIGNAKTAGMAKDLALTDSQYSLAVTTFQIGYVVAGPPSNMILTRTRPSIYIPILMILWGTVVACLATVKTPAQLLGVRFLLGIMEAGFSPAVLFIISSWYRKHEQSKRFMIFLSAGILSGAFGVRPFL